LLTLALERRPLTFERLQVRGRLLEPCARLPQCLLDFSAFADHGLDVGCQAFDASRIFASALPDGLELCSQPGTFVERAIDLCLQFVAQSLAALDSGARIRQLGLEPGDLRAGARNLFPASSDLLLALDHTLVRPRVAVDAQPMSSDPDAVPRDDRLTREQSLAARKRLGE